jgi:hypothetical protein
VPTRARSFLFCDVCVLSEYADFNKFGSLTMVYYTMPDPFFRSVHARLEAPIMEGDDEYTAMIRSLIFLVDCYALDDVDGILPQAPDSLRVDDNTCSWMMGKMFCTPHEERTALVSLFAYVSRFDSPFSRAIVDFQLNNEEGLVFQRRFRFCTGSSSLNEMIRYGNFIIYPTVRWGSGWDNDSSLNNN